jgi:hypothetical protein
MRKLTYFFLFIVLVTICYSTLRRRELFAGYAAGHQDLRKERYEKARRSAPVADMNESEPDNSEKGRSMKEKKKRYDSFKMVAPKPEPWVAERVLSSEGFSSFPALPVSVSQVILIGVVSESEAHISENKKGLYSEFKLTVESVLKATDQEIHQGSQVKVDRVGGYVKYPNGQQILYRIQGLNMPQVGSRYLFFLSSKRKPDLIIITAYELTSEGVMPLDISSEHLALEGITEAELQNRIRDLLKK